MIYPTIKTILWLSQKHVITPADTVCQTGCKGLKKGPGYIYNVDNIYIIIYNICLVTSLLHSGAWGNILAFHQDRLKRWKADTSGAQCVLTDSLSEKSDCSGKEESSCSAGELVEETTTGTRSLCGAGERYFKKGPVPFVLNVFILVFIVLKCSHYH